MTDLARIGFAADTSGLTKAQRELGNLATKGEQTEKTLKNTDKALGGMGRKAGQAGIQLQQFIGQVQGGQSAMLALSQQSADLGFVLGAPLLGAVVGIGASMAGLLLPNIFKTTNAMTELEKVAEALKVSLVEAADGSDLLSAKIEKLAKRSESLAKLQIAASIQDAEKQIKISAKGIEDALDSAFGMTTESVLRGFSDEVSKSAAKANVSITELVNQIADGNIKLLTFGQGAKMADTVRVIADQFDITRKQAASLSIAISDVFSDQSVINIKKLENALSDIIDESDGTNDKFGALLKTILPLFDATFDGVDKVNLLRKAFGDLTKQIKESSETGDELKTKVKDIIAGLEGQIIALRDGEQAALRYSIAQSLSLKAADEFPAAISKQIDELYRLRDAQAEIENQAKSEKSFLSMVNALDMQRQKLALTSDEFEIYQLRMKAIANDVAPEFIDKLVETAKANQALQKSLNESSDFDKDLESLIGKTNDFGNAWTITGNAIVDAFGSAASQISSFAAEMQQITDLQAEFNAKREQAIKLGKDTTKIDQQLAALNERSYSAQIGAVGKLAGMTSQMFKENSKERKALHALEMGFMAAEIVLATEKAIVAAVGAVANQGSGDPYSAFGRIATMVGIMAGVLGAAGIAFSGGSSGGYSSLGNEGSGTVLGSSDASSSVSNSSEMFKDIALDQLAELRGIRNALSTVTQGIDRLAADLIMGVDFNQSFSNTQLGTTRKFGGYNRNDATASLMALTGGADVAGAFVGNVLDKIFGGALTKQFNKMLGSFDKTTKKLVDSGIKFFEQSLGSIFESGEIDAAMFQVIETTRRKFFGLSKKTSTAEETQAISNEFAQQIGKIFELIGTSALDAAILLGTDTEEALNDLVKGFVLDIGDLALKDKTGEEIQQLLNSVISQQADLIATHLVPALKDYQKVNEGAFETLQRLAYEQAIFNDSLDMLGVNLSSLSAIMQIDVAQNMINLAGGIGEFANATAEYFDLFYSEEEKLAQRAGALSEVFASVNQELPASKEAFREIIDLLSQGLDNEQNQEAFVLLTSIAPAFAEYLDMLEKQKETIEEISKSDIDSALNALAGAISLEKQLISEQLRNAKDLHSAEMQRITETRNELESMFDALTDGVNNAKSALIASFDKQKELIQDASALRIDGLTQELELINNEIRNRQSRLSQLESVQSKFTGGSQSNEQLATSLSQALSAARRGNFELAANANLSQGTGFASAIDKMIFEAEQAFRSAEIGRLAGQQIPVEEQIIASLERSAGITESAIENEKERAEKQISLLQDQLDQLLGVDKTVLSIDAAIANLNSTQFELNELDYQRQLDMLSEQEDLANKALDQAQDLHDQQVSKLDDLFNVNRMQLYAAYNIDSGIRTLTEAIRVVQNLIAQGNAEQSAANSAIAKATQTTADIQRRFEYNGITTNPSV